MSLARVVSLLEHQLRRARRMLLPECFNLIVRRLPLGDRGSPVAEDGRRLGLVALGPRDLQLLAHITGHKVGPGVRSVGHREPEPAQVVALVVVAIPAAMPLGELEGQDGACREGYRLLEHEDGIARYVSPPRARVVAPGRLVLAVDRIGDWPGDPAAMAPVVED